MNDAILRAIRKHMEPLQRRINNMIARGVITALNDAEGLQGVQATLTQGEVFDGMERVQQYGFSSHPPIGSEIVALFLNGNRDHPLVLGVDNREVRLRNQLPGDASIYSLLQNFVSAKADGSIVLQGIAGNSITLTPTGEIVLTAGGSTMTLSGTGTARIQAPDLELHGVASLKLDAGGTGVHYVPGAYVSYTTGASGTSAPIHPPEIP